MTTPGLETAIQSLPPELREMILKEVITAKVKERKEMGWGAVHEEVKNVDPGMATCWLCGDKTKLIADVQSRAELVTICSVCMLECREFDEGPFPFEEQELCLNCNNRRWGGACDCPRWMDE